MAGVRHPSTANINSLIKELKTRRRRYIKFMKSIPDMDAYAYLYSVLSYHVNHIDECLEGLKPGLKMAKEELKRNPKQYANRAKQWSHHNDSRRKPSPSSEDAASFTP